MMTGGLSKLAKDVHPKWGICQSAFSLIFGFMAILIPVIVLAWRGHQFGVGSSPEVPIALIPSGIFGTLGLIFGITGLKSAKKVAVIGLIVSGISLLFWLYLLVGWLIFEYC